MGEEGTLLMLIWGVLLHKQRTDDETWMTELLVATLNRYEICLTNKGNISGFLVSEAYWFSLLPINVIVDVCFRAHVDLIDSH